jgi:hypothetical protein
MSLLGSVRSNENGDFNMHFFADQAVVRVISRRDKGAPHPVSRQEP